ncbi:MAG: hypothetical protein JJT77_00525 [Crocinitomicaceae bacterium]|nr:hypothetical protein [Crocinitomicaceae bacterium]
MLKRTFFLGVAVATLGLTSCKSGSGEYADLCDCIQIQLDMMDDYEAAGYDQEKLEAIEDKYKADAEKCEAIGREFQKSMEGLSEEEAEAKEKDIADACPAFKKLQDKIEEQMRAFEESMQSFDFDDMDMDDMMFDEDMELEFEEESAQ